MLEFALCVLVGLQESVLFSMIPPATVTQRNSLCNGRPVRDEARSPHSVAICHVVRLSRELAQSN